MPNKRRYELRDPALNDALDALVAQASEAYGRKDERALEEVRQLVVTAFRLLRDDASTGDLRLSNHTLKELRHSFRVFEPYRAIRKVAVFGSARTGSDWPDYRQAREFSRRIAEAGWMVITGAGGGIMHAAQEGAGREASFGVNIRLPFEQMANEIIAGDPKLINFRYFFTRKVAFVKEAHAIALFPGGFGTHDEGFEALTLIQTGKGEVMPVVFVDSPGQHYWRDWEEYVRSHLQARGLISPADLSLFKVTDDVDVALHEITNFYSNYHSSRYVGERLVIRLRQAPDAEQLEALNASFEDIIAKGAIEVTPPLSGEADEAPGQQRITFHFDRRSVGRLRQLIDRLNELVPDEARTPQNALPHEIVATPFSPEAEFALEDENGGDEDED